MTCSNEAFDDIAVRAASLAAALLIAAARHGEAQFSSIEDTVRVGCSGGRTGGGGGTTITRRGQLSSYARSLRAGDDYTHLRRDSAAAAAVFAELERIRFRALQHRRVGNMTCVLELRDAAGEHYVAWPMGRPPAVLEPVLAALKRAVGDDRRGWP